MGSLKVARSWFTFSEKEINRRKSFSLTLCRGVKGSFSTQNKQTFETLLFLDSDSCQSKRQKEIFFLNIVSKEERILPTKSGQAFEAMTILSKAKAFAVIAQGVRRNFFLNILLKNEEILSTKSKRTFEIASL